MSSEVDTETEISVEDESSSGDEIDIKFEGEIEKPVSFYGNTDLIEEETSENDKTKVLDLNEILQINAPAYEDVTLMINSTVPFLIDADALVMYAFLQDDHEVSLGGQYLHVIYYCERFLNTLLEKGGNFILIFFDVWKIFWETNSYIHSLRLSIYAHFKKNTNYRVFNFSTFNNELFKKFIDIEKPRCCLLDLSYHLTLGDFNDRVSAKHTNELIADVEVALLINCTEIVFFVSHDLPCIDICQINIDECIISTFNLHGFYPSRDLLDTLLRKMIDIKVYDSLALSKEFRTKTDFSGCDARRTAVVIAASKFRSITENDNELKLILLCYAALEVLHLENRCCPIFLLKKETLHKIQNIVLKWLNCLSYALKHCMKQKITLVWNTVGDIWQGTMFNYICYMVQSNIHRGSDLGHFQEAYEHYTELVAHETNKKIELYPIIPLCGTESGMLITSNVMEESGQLSLYLLNNPVIRSFCGNAFQNVKWQNPFTNLEFEEFDETRHWHCKKPMTDEYDRMKENNFGIKAVLTKAQQQYYERRKQKDIHTFARYLNLYGYNLEGGSIKAETIICQQQIKETKIKKEGKKVIELKEKIKKDKDKKNLAKEQELVKDLKTRLKLYSSSLNITEKLSDISLTLKRLTVKEAILTAKLFELEVYRDYIKNVRADEINIEYLKEIFVKLQVILIDHFDVIKEKDKIFLSKLLHELGLEEIARRNNLPMDIKFNNVIKLNWIRFQLQYLGAKMERLSVGAYDPDIGFTPDPWQTDFINAIRKKQSALVVAPTSSGKTFAAYYCMKRVLQESEEGVVVYVAPTKALVNQVQATVYARFKNAKLRDGKAIVGVFTRDYKNNTLNSRILVTVPQCLDILLLSPRRFTWFKNVKYVIFDEVHKLSGSEEGLVWERCLLLVRCPFLALSATISDIHEFHKWLQTNENFKREQDKLHGEMRKSYEVILVQHTERHSDLIKYVYSEETDLQHYHPYYALSSKILKMYNGVPSTIQLSPHEVLLLFDAMYSNEYVRSKLSHERDISNFFFNKSKNGFITRNEVREYEKIIANVFYEVHKEDERICLRIIKDLEPNSLPTKVSEVAELPDLLNRMYEKNLLPCIVFSYNRNLIEYGTYLLVQDLKKNEEIEVDRRVKKESEKIAKMEKKLRHKEEGSNKDNTRQLNVVKSSGILRTTGSKFKGEGIADSSDLKLIERRLSKTDYNPLFIQSLPYGIAYHHGGLNNTLRSTVEILFRMGILKVILATGTLALGIHMPCKSVVIFGDSPFLNSLEYHQISGRAGRRGFDTEGNVIFMGLTQKRVDMLMTDKLPKMLGNFPINVTLVARLLLLVTKVTDKGISSDEVTRITSARVLALLENSLIFQFKPNLKVQIKHFVDFAAQLLYIQGLYNADGVPLKLASIINHLHYHEPSNLVFAYLLRTGALRELILSMRNSTNIEWSLIIVLSHLFARLKLHKSQLQRKFNNSVVKLEPLPDVILKAIEKYNREVKFIFDEYFISVAKHLAENLGKDDTLPVSKIKFIPMYSYENAEHPDTLSAKIKSSCIKRIACSTFVGLSGNTDRNLYTGTMISNIRHEICPGIKVVPLIETDVVFNSYAADFYRHGIVEAIVNDNGLKSGAEFALIKDFLLVLKSILMCLEELEPINQDDPVYIHFKHITSKFDQRFKNAFN